jgi:formylglycine-generating enzyme required for sulfatase activity
LEVLLLRRLILLLTLLFLAVLLGQSCGRETPDPGPTPLPIPSTDAGLPAVTATQTPAAGETRIRPSDGMALVFVPGGSFEMGSSDAEMADVLAECPYCNQDWFRGEQPAHRVSLAAYWIDQTEVSNEQYLGCFEAGTCERPHCWDDTHFNGLSQPVVCVDWFQAQAYCEWTGGRLPTEAEWEYAARGSQGRIYPWGDFFDGTRLNFCDLYCDQEWKASEYDDGYPWTAPVGNYSEGASWCGALDMAGNVLEWVNDWFDEDYYADTPVDNPLGPAAGEGRGLRGGAWVYDRWGARCASRERADPTYQNVDTGFRCVVEVDGQD